MHRSRKASVQLARILFCCFVSLGSGMNAQAEDLLAWRQSGSVYELIEHLEDWLDANTNLPRREALPVVRLTTRGNIASLSGSGHTTFVDTARGLYDSDSTTIWLVMPWSGRDPRDVSVLLHELTHHRQAGHGHWYCPAAQELPAYRTQQAWLAELGLALDINWIAVVLDAGCTPRDIHPD